MDEELLNQYQAYVLRLWKDGAETPWRASLEAVDGGARYNFADVERLIHFLQTATITPHEQGESDVEATHE